METHYDHNQDDATKPSLAVSLLAYKISDSGVKRGVERSDGSRRSKIGGREVGDNRLSARNQANLAPVDLTCDAGVHQVMVDRIRSALPSIVRTVTEYLHLGNCEL